MLHQYNFQYTNDVNWLGIIPVGKTISILQTRQENIHMETHYKLIGIELPNAKILDFTRSDVTEIERCEKLTPIAIIVMILFLVIFPGGGIIFLFISCVLCRTTCFKIGLKYGESIDFFAYGPEAENFISEIMPNYSYNRTNNGFINNCNRH